MTCGGCAAQVQKALAGIAGVKDVNVNFATETATIRLGTPPAKQAELIGAVAKAGYEAEPIRQAHSLAGTLEDSHREQLRRQRIALIQTAVIAAPLFGLHWIGPKHPSHEAAGLWRGLASALLSATLLGLSAGRLILVGGYRAIIHRSPNMDLLIAIGVSVAFVAGVVSLVARGGHAEHFHALGMILLFINLGRYLEIHARHGASQAISALVKRMPATALIATKGGTKEVPLGQIQRRDHVVVPQDTIVPVDGKVIKGAGAIDESALTGESTPRSCQEGDTAQAGTLVVEGTLTVRATHVGSDSAMGRIIRVVEEAQAGRTKMQNLADRVAGMFVPIVIVLAVLTFAGWLILGPDIGKAAQAAVAVVLIACPCAMGLATPTAVLVSSGTAALNGVLVRDAAALESAGELDVMLFDKTGILTTGRPEVKEIFDEPIGSATLDERQVLQWAASVEQYSQHALAKAILNRARERRLDLKEPASFESTPGRGVRAELDGKTVLVGSAAYLRDRGVALEAVERRVKQLAEGGQSVVLLAIDGVCAGLLSLTDTIRPEAGRSIEALRALGVTPILVSGDMASTAIAVGGQLGFSEIHAEMTPEDKLEEVRRQQAAGRRVGFIGDGVNDAPALAGADVGITIASATDVAGASASITILHDDLERLPYIIKLARRSRTVIKQNLFWAFFYNLVALPLAIAGQVPPGIAAAAMMASSICVVLNSLRLRERGTVSPARKTPDGGSPPRSFSG